MDDKALEALRKSIAHWKQNLEATRPEDVHVGVVHCALCDAFYEGYCVDCPVQKRTRLWGCVGSPYRAACNARARWETAPNNESLRRVARNAIQAEIDFLESLLPENAE